MGNHDKMIDRKAMGARLRVRREAAGLTQSEAARAAGITQSRVCALENGKVAGVSYYTRYEAIFALAVEASSDPRTQAKAETMRRWREMTGAEIDRRCRALVRALAASCKVCHRRNTLICEKCDVRDAPRIAELMVQEEAAHG